MYKRQCQFLSQLSFHNLVINLWVISFLTFLPTFSFFCLLIISVFSLSYVMLHNASPPKLIISKIKIIFFWNHQYSSLNQVVVIMEFINRYFLLYLFLLSHGSWYGTWYYSPSFSFITSVIPCMFYLPKIFFSPIHINRY